MVHIYSFDLFLCIPEKTLGYNLTDVPKMLNELNVKELTRKQSRITLKNLVLYLHISSHDLFFPSLVPQQLLTKKWFGDKTTFPLMAHTHTHFFFFMV